MLTISARVTLRYCTPVDCGLCKPHLGLPAQDLILQYCNQVMASVAASSRSSHYDMHERWVIALSLQASYSAREDLLSQTQMLLQGAGRWQIATASLRMQASGSSSTC